MNWRSLYTSSGASLAPALLAVMFLVGCREEPESSMGELYPPPWYREFSVEISKALAVNNIKGCGQYMYRKSSRQRGEFLVYCTGDGKFWTAYLVWAPIESVMGPYPPDRTIPAPDPTP